MAKTPINEQFIKMQKLAGVITESQYVNQINEMYLDDPATVWNKEEEKGGLPFEEKESILLPFLDGAEDINMWANTSFDNLEDNMKTAVRKYLMSSPETNPNNFTDDYEIERDEPPFGNDAMFEAKKPKMTKTELKEAIRQEILAALTEDNLTEADEEEEEEEVALDAETEETPADDTEAEPNDTAGDTTNSQDVQKELTDALEAAKKLGDKKLVRQIGNALTYFTRQQISSEEV